jgi:hypothetical protein
LQGAPGNIAWACHAEKSDPTIEIGRVSTEFNVLPGRLVGGFEMSEKSAILGFRVLLRDRVG